MQTQFQLNNRIQKKLQQFFNHTITMASRRILPSEETAPRPPRSTISAGIEESTNSVSRYTTLSFSAFLISFSILTFKLRQKYNKISDLCGFLLVWLNLASSGMFLSMSISKFGRYCVTMVIFLSYIPFFN